MTKTTFIYALKEPDTGEIRYIGKANDPEYRFRKHLNRASVGKYYSSYWINSLLKRSLQPTLEILDEVPYEFWPQWEVAYIEFFRESGCKLVNLGFGGEGVSMTPEVHRKMSEKMLGNTRWSGKTLSIEHKEKISRSKKGKKILSGPSEKRSSAMRLRWEKKRQEEVLAVMWR